MNTTRIAFKHRWLALTVVLLWLIASCSPSEKADEMLLGKGDTPNCSKNWTVLVYAAAHNNLERFEVTSLAEMARVGSSDQINVVVQMDRGTGEKGEYGEEQTSKNTSLIWKGTRRMYIREGTIDYLEDLKEQNSADPQTLANFIQWGIKKYPANHYALFFMDHGNAWAGAFHDDAANARMPLPGIRQGLEDGLAQSAVKQFDIITFHTCLMANLAVATELAPYTRYLIGSEEVLYTDGKVWDYYGTLNYLKNKPNALARDLADAIFDGFTQQCQRVQDKLATKCFDRITYSILDTQHVSELANQVHSLADEIYPWFATEERKWVSLLKSRYATEEYGSWGTSQVVDLKYLTEQLSAQAIPDSWQAKIKDIQETIPKVVIRAHKGRDGTYLGHAMGLSIYFPKTRPLEGNIFNDLKIYSQTKFAQMKANTTSQGWGGLVLTTYLSKAIDAPPKLGPVSTTKGINEVMINSTLDKPMYANYLLAFIAIPDAKAENRMRLIHSLPTAPANNVLASIDLQKVPMLTDQSSTVLAPIKFTDSSMKAWLNHKTDYLVGDINIQVRIQYKDKMYDRLGSIPVSYYPQSGKIIMCQAEYRPRGYEIYGLNMELIKEGDQFRIMNQFIEQTNQEVQVKEEADAEHWFTWDLTKLRVISQALPKTESNYTAGVLLKDLDGKTSLSISHQ